MCMCVFSGLCEGVQVRVCECVLDVGREAVCVWLWRVAERVLSDAGDPVVWCQGEGRARGGARWRLEPEGGGP